jgi:hypothetical protein
MEYQQEQLMGRINLYIATVLLILIGVSCKNVIGIYNHKINETGPDFITLTLRTDSVFVFNSWSDITGPESIEGRWNLIKDTVKLRRTKPAVEERIFLEIIDNPSDEERKITIMNYQDSSKILGAKILINGSDSAQYSNYYGEIILKKDLRVNEIKVEYLAFTQEIRTDNNLASHYLVYLDLSTVKIETFKIFEKWIWKGNKLIPVNEENRVLHESYLKKINR